LKNCLHADDKAEPRRSSRGSAVFSPDSGCKVNGDTINEPFIINDDPKMSFMTTTAMTKWQHQLHDNTATRNRQILEWLKG
jgi:hypothetical protein